MPNMSVRVEGLQELISNFSRAPDIVKNGFQKAVDRAMLGIEGAAKPITPIDTSVLRNSIFSALFTDKIGGFIATGPEAPYAAYVHEGTSSWPLDMGPKNPNTVRQFFLKAVEMTEVDRNSLFQKAAADVAAALTK